MINNIKFNIQLDVQGLSRKEYSLILELFTKNIYECDLNNTISLIELDNILHLSSRRFLTKSIEYPKMTHDELDIRETNIEIIG
jgi:hypothetical protein